MSIVYGPVPSRRLGRSLGINNIPPKVCSYSCVYCQVGLTTEETTERRGFYSSEQIFQEVQQKITELSKKREQVNFLSFVPDGEPTLDNNLGKTIEMLRPLGVKIAVITNGSLLWREDIRKDLMKADWVSLKVDAVSELVWHSINRPHKTLTPERVLDGMREFARSFTGELATETMLLSDMNSRLQELENIAGYLAELKPRKAYIAIPTRPPAVSTIKAADEVVATIAYQLFIDRVKHVEYLIGYEGNDFAATGNVEADILSITAVHPMREEAIKELLNKSRSNWERVETLVTRGLLYKTTYRGQQFYLRNFSSLNEEKKDTA